MRIISYVTALLKTEKKKSHPEWGGRNFSLGVYFVAFVQFPDVPIVSMEHRCFQGDNYTFLGLLQEEVT